MKRSLRIGVISSLNNFRRDETTWYNNARFDQKTIISKLEFKTWVKIWIYNFFPTWASLILCEWICTPFCALLYLLFEKKYTSKPDLRHHPQIRGISYSRCWELRKQIPQTKPTSQLQMGWSPILDGLEKPSIELCRIKLPVDEEILLLKLDLRRTNPGRTVYKGIKRQDIQHRTRHPQLLVYD